MKNYLVALAIGVLMSSFLQAKDPKLAMPELLTADILAELSEPSFKSGSGGGDVVRVIVIRSFAPTLVIKWFPNAEADKTRLQIKRKGAQNRPVEIIDLKLTEGQHKSLFSLLKGADAQGLDRKDWRTQDFADGSRWIYEFASEKDVFMLLRANPLSNPSQSEAVDSNISKERLWREQLLSFFVCSALGISGIDDNVYE